MKDRNGHLFELPVSGKIFPLIGGEIDFYDMLPTNRPGGVSFNGKEYPWTVWGENLTPGKNTEVWATYTNDYYAGNAAVTHHRLGKGSVTYIGVESKDGAVEKEVLKRIYSNLSIPLMDLPEGVWMEYRDGFGIAVNYSSDNYQFPLPANAKVVIGEPTIQPAQVLVWQF